MNKELLQKYFQGKCTLSEKQELYQYFRSRDMEAFDEYVKEQDSDRAGSYTDPAYREKFYKKIREHIREQEEVKTVRRAIDPVLRIAAGIVLVLGIAGLIWAGMKKNTATPVAVYKAYHNNTDNVRRIHLRDGTHVWLNPGTTISYNNRLYQQSSRDVEISGEAYFDVAHDKAIPFRVYTGKMITKVMGTAFNVEAYKHEQRIRITLVRGRVDVQTGNTINKLKAGQLLTYHRTTNTADTRSFDLSEKQGLFTSGKIVLEDVPLQDVMDRLEVAFGIQIICSNNLVLKDKTITGSYARNSAEETLKRILFIHSLKYYKKDNKTYMVNE